MTEQRYFRRVIAICAEDSPNVRLALEQQKRGEEPTGLRPDGSVPVPGVLTWEEYKQRRATWDIMRQTIGLDAKFYKGASVMLFPPAWLGLAGARARQMESLGVKRRVLGIGVDPGEGSAQTAWAAVDEHGVVDLQYKETPDTSAVTGDTIAFMHKHGMGKDQAERVFFDKGGGGKQHADRLRAEGYEVRTVAFGESMIPDDSQGRTVKGRTKVVDERDERYAFRFRRDKMYMDVRNLLDPSLNPASFGIPDYCKDLHRQMGRIPLMYDDEGRMRLPPKGQPYKDDKTKTTLYKLLGESPDQTDALVLAVYAMQYEHIIPEVGMG